MRRSSSGIRKAMESVFPPDRDERWQKRRNDLNRCVTDVYRKEAARRAHAGSPRAEPGWPGGITLGASSWKLAFRLAGLRASGCASITCH